MLKGIEYYTGCRNALNEVLRTMNKNNKGYKVTEELLVKVNEKLEQLNKERIANNKVTMDKKDKNYISKSNGAVDTRDRYEDKRKDQGNEYKKETEACFFKWVPKVQKNQKFYYAEIKANCKFWKAHECKNSAKCHKCPKVSKFANQWYDLLINPNSDKSGAKAPDNTKVRKNHTIINPQYDEKECTNCIKQHTVYDICISCPKRKEI